MLLSSLLTSHKVQEGLSGTSKEANKEVSAVETLTFDQNVN